MSETKPNEQPVKPPRKAQGGAPKSMGVTLKDPAGDIMRITAVAKKDGSAHTYVIHRVLADDGTTKSVARGASQQHVNMDAARAVVEKLKTAAVAAGWIAKVAAVGRSKPDAFDALNLPKPRKAKK